MPEKINLIIKEITSKNWFLVYVRIYGHVYIIPKEVLIIKGNKIENILLSINHWINIRFLRSPHLWYQ